MHVGRTDRGGRYGLTVEHELRLLEIGRRLHAEGIARTTTTLLDAHAIPPAGGLLDVGSIHVGARADLVSYDQEDPRVLAYALSGIQARLVILAGTVVVGEANVPSIAEKTLW